MKKLALLAPLALAACMSNNYDEDPYGGPDSGMGEPYRAIGNEPYWSLDISDGQLRFRNADGYAASDSNFTYTRDPRLGDVYEGRRIRATIIDRRCSDGMSDRTYPDTVTVEIGTQTWRGCGAPVRFFETTDERGDYVATTPAMSRDALADTKWRIVSINGTPTSPDGSYELRFEANRIYAHFDCNRMNANYGFNGSTLTVGPVMSTKMGCPSGSMEPAGAAILSEPIDVRIEGSQVVLANARGTMTAVKTY